MELYNFKELPPKSPICEWCGGECHKHAIQLRYRSPTEYFKGHWVSASCYELMDLCEEAIESDNT